MAQLPGFAPVSSVMPIGAGARVERRIVMPIGTLQETITVKCGRTTQPSPQAQPSAPRPTRVLDTGPRRVAPAAAAAVPFSGGIGGQIKAPAQIAKANPICPNHIGIDTTVVLGARVGIDGYLSDIRLLNAQTDPAAEIVDSAMDAVRLCRRCSTAFPLKQTSR
jgi:hypothetical protein